MAKSNRQLPALWLAGVGLVALADGTAVAGSANAPPRVQTLIDSATAAMRNDPEASRRDAESALEQLARQPDADLEIEARLLLCDYYSERDRTAAEQQIAAANALLPQARQAGLKAGILTCQGETLEATGANAEAQPLFEQAVNIASAAHDEQRLAEALFSRGYLLGIQGQYADGLADLRRSQGLFDKIGKPVHALTVMNTIATMYTLMGDYTEAVHIYERALATQRAGNMRRDEAVTLHNLGRVHEQLAQWPAARENFAAALAICEEIDYPRGSAYALRGLAAVDNADSQPLRALSLLDRATALQRQTQDARLGAQIQLARGVSLHLLGRLNDSMAALQQALVVFRQADSRSELSAAYAELAAVQAQTGDWHSAYESRTQAQTVSDTLLRSQLDQRFATLKVEFDTAVKEQENAALLRENAATEQALDQGRRATRLQTAVITLSAMLLALLSILVVHQRRSARRMQALAMTDELTGLPNRREVLGRLAGLLQSPDVSRCALLIVDLDHFKSINDRHGHPVGDETLKRVSTTLRTAIAEPNFLGRLGGEEFAIVLADAGADAALSVAEGLRTQVMTVDLAHWFGDRRLTASIGITVAEADDSIATMLRRADAALYAAKHAGRNCVRIDPAPAAPAAPTVPASRVANWHGAKTA
jgi:diguanylate cyclase (GGDEF)-like protein